MKRYYTLYDLASMLNTNDRTIKKVIGSFRIKEYKNNGKQCICVDELELFKKSYLFKKTSGLNYSYIETMPKYIIKDLINRL